MRHVAAAAPDQELSGVEHVGGVVAASRGRVDWTTGIKRRLDPTSAGVVRGNGRRPVLEPVEVRSQQLGRVLGLSPDVLEVRRPHAECVRVSLPDPEAVELRSRLTGTLGEVPHDVLEVGLAPPESVEQPGRQLLLLLELVDEGPVLLGPRDCLPK